MLNLKLKNHKLLLKVGMNQTVSRNVLIYKPCGKAVSFLILVTVIVKIETLASPFGIFPKIRKQVKKIYITRP